MGRAIRRSSLPVFKTLHNAEGESRLTGYHNLLLAVLERALLDFHTFYHPGNQIKPPYLSRLNAPNRFLRQSNKLKNTSPHYRPSRALGSGNTRLDALHAENWFTSDSYQPFSFLWLCEHLFAEPMFMANVIRKYCHRIKREYKVMYDPKRKERNRAKLDAIFSEIPTEIFAVE